ncbi:MAG TPA: hypothetical protein VFK02_16175 [Kofleriaceae bacterium]|nr:hypothetical protein [Kofleriaceae bacterium]
MRDRLRRFLLPPRRPERVFPFFQRRLIEQRNASYLPPKMQRKALGAAYISWVDESVPSVVSWSTTMFWHPAG